MTFQAKRGLRTSPLEILSAVLVLVVMIAARNWQMVALVLGLIVLFVFMHRSRGDATLTLGDSSLSFRMGKITKQADWCDISHATLNGNRLVGKSVRIRAAPMSAGVGTRSKQLVFDIPDIFGDGIEAVFQHICARLPSKSK